MAVGILANPHRLYIQNNCSVGTAWLKRYYLRCSRHIWLYDFVLGPWRTTKRPERTVPSPSKRRHGKCKSENGVAIRLGEGFDDIRHYTDRLSAIIYEQILKEGLGCRSVSNSWQGKQEEYPAGGAETARPVQQLLMSVQKIISWAVSWLELPLISRWE